MVMSTEYAKTVTYVCLLHTTTLQFLPHIKLRTQSLVKPAHLTEY